ncbi:MAG: S9 family peptidase [Francisellaceae bacterium]|mgnify:CR=1 FL=1|nr:S9 family peptidase [Francisellaceae bacterium]MBT6206921.1 S9 family peptidase [Francisellaceae bacterium]
MTYWNADKITKSLITYCDLSVDNDGTQYFLRTSPTSGKLILTSCENNKLRFFESIRPGSHMYEYGGRSYHVHENTCYYICSDSGFILSCDLVTEDKEIIVDNGIYCCPTYTSAGIIFLKDEIAEKNTCAISIYSFEKKAVIELFSGYKYISDVAIDTTKGSIAWVCGNSMPWESTNLYKAILNGIDISKITCIGDSSNVSYCEPQWGQDGELYCINDSNNWWNIYRVEADNNLTNICSLPNDFSKPAWVQGKYNYSITNDYIIANYLVDGYCQLITINLNDLQITKIPTEPGYIGELSNIVNSYFSYLIFTTNKLPCIYLYNLSTMSQQAVEKLDLQIPQSHISIPEIINIPNNTGNINCLYYPPTNEADSSCPLLLKIHGGPTSMSYPGIDPKIQFWTSRNFAVLDVNYGGSSGFGREYRDLLYGNWGRKDVLDCITAIEYIFKEKPINLQQVFARGSSAGGFTVLNILGTSNIIKKASCYYSVTDLESLTNSETNSLENSYINSLVGKHLTKNELYVLSPISKVANISTEVIFFQGLKDTVVLPEQSEVMFNALKDNGINCEYIEYPDEGHSFKSAEVIKDALEKEYVFFSTV